MPAGAKKLVLFGAGKIGRSFIGQLFSRSGYEVVFIDIDTRIIDALNEKHSYKIFICDKNPETIVINNVRGVHADDNEQVINEIISTDYLAISIGKNALKHIAPLLSRGLLIREEKYPGRMLDIILAENMRNADDFLRDALLEILPATYPLEMRVGLIETSIGKMVPSIVNKKTEDNLSVYAEAYNTLIVNKEAFMNPVPAVSGLDAKDNIKAWVDRKMFIHNFGHASLAYLGYKYHPDLHYLWEVLENKEIKLFVRDAMRQSADALLLEYPDVFTKDKLYEHIDDLIERFANRELGDTIFRVGCDLYRKLAPDDRVITPLRSAYNNKLPYNLITEVLRAALQFKATDADGKMLPLDLDFHNELKEKGANHILQKICGFTESE